jgi:3-hydroxyisobutyrate dehydrogenase
VAANLLKSGLPVLVFDRNPAAVDKLVKMGATAVGSPQEMGETPGKAAAAAAAAARHST